MDDPALDPGEHARALAGLARINRLSAAAASIAPPARRLSAEPDRPLRVLDVACGSADVSLALVRRLGRPCDLTLLDASPVAAAQAEARARRAGVSARVQVADALAADLPPADLVMCSLFLHHLAEPDAVRLLAAMRRAAARMVILNDLRRGPWGSVLARAVPRLVTRSPVVHADARRSADAAFTVPELRALADRAGLTGARIRPVFPARMTLCWTPAP